MTEDGKGAEGEPPNEPKFDLRRAAMTEVGSPVGKLLIRPVYGTDVVEIADAAPDTPEALGRLILTKTAVFEDDDRPLDDHAVEALIADADFLENLVPINWRFYSRSRKAKKGEVSIQRDILVERAGDEGPLEFLFRSLPTLQEEWEAIRKKSEEPWKKILEQLDQPGLAWVKRNQEILDRFANIRDRLGPDLSGIIGPRTAQSQAAEAFYRGISPTPNEIRAMAQVQRDEEDKAERFRPLPDPAYEMQKHLEALRDAQEEMRELTRDSAKLQEGTYEINKQLLSGSLQRAQASDAAAAKQLRIAKFAIAIALLSTIATVISSVIPLINAPDYSAIVEPQMRIEALLEHQNQLLTEQIEAASEEKPQAASAAPGPT